MPLESSMAGGEWNAQRLKRLLESDVERITAAAVRDGKVAMPRLSPPLSPSLSRGVTPSASRL